MCHIMRPIKGLGIRVVLFGFVVLFTYLDRVEGGDVQCYVCSWHKPSGNQNTTVVDTCTHYNFRYEYASAVNCTSGGCEAIAYRHSKNEEIIHFYRNCLNSRKGLQPEDKCYAKEQKTEYLNVCECHSNLCNSAQLYMPTLNLLSLETFSVLGLLVHHYSY